MLKHTIILAVRATCVTLFVGLLWFGMNSAHAQQITSGEPFLTNKDCNGLDLVVLIDQSQSMLYNDRRDARFEATRLIIDFLGNHAVWLCYGQDVQHRLAVVGFGDKSEYNPGGLSQPNNYEEDVITYIEPTIIPETDNFEAWKQQRANLKTELNNYRQTDDILGATDHQSALLKALDILRGWQSEPLSGADRRKLVVLITDGGPCQRSDGCGYDGSGYSYGPAMAELVDFMDAQGSNYPWTGNNPESIFVSMIAMTDSRENYRLNTTIQNNWNAIVANRGQVFAANALNTDLSTGVSNILSPLIGSTLEKITCDQEIWVQPYLDDLLIFYVFAQGAVDGNLDDVGATIRITRGDEVVEVRDGKTNAASNFIQEYSQDGGNEFYVLSPSLPGQYTVQAQGIGNLCQDVDIRLQRNSITAHLVTPGQTAYFPEILQPPFYREGVSQRFELDIRARGENDANAEGVPLVEYPNFPLDMKVHIASDDGTHTQDMGFLLKDSATPGIYISQDYIQTPVPGRYQWKIEATAPSVRPDIQVVELFRDQDQLQGYFIVGKVTRFAFAVTSPQVGDTIALNTTQGTRQIPVDIPISLRLTDPDGNDIPAASVLDNTQQVFEASLSSDTGQLIDTVQLSLKPGTSNEFYGIFTNNINGAPVSPGRYVVEVRSLWDTYDYNPNKVAPVLDYASVNIQQYAITPVDVVIYPPPSPSRIHPRFLASINDTWALFRGVPRPFNYEIEVVNALTQEPLDLSLVLQDTDQAFTGKVVSPSDRALTGQLLAALDMQPQRLIGSAGSDVDEAGEYEIALELADLPLQDAYAWSRAEASATFDRDDELMTSPTFARAIIGGAAVLLAAFLIWLIYTLTGGPAGQISIVRRKPKGNYETVAGPWQLSYVPRRNRIQKSKLEELGVKRLVVRKTKSLEEGVKYAVSIEAFDTSDQPLFSGTLHSGMAESFIEAGDIMYSQGNSSPMTQ